METLVKPSLIQRLEERIENQRSMIATMQRREVATQRSHFDQAETIRAMHEHQESLDKIVEAMGAAGEDMTKAFAKMTDELVQTQRSAEEWEKAAAMFGRGSDFYHGLIVRCGKALGPDAYLCEDGTYSHDVLALNVPELVENLCKPNRIQRALSILITGK